MHDLPFVWCPPLTFSCFVSGVLYDVGEEAVFAEGVQCVGGKLELDEGFYM